MYVVFNQSAASYSNVSTSVRFRTALILLPLEWNIEYYIFTHIYVQHYKKTGQGNKNIYYPAEHMTNGKRDWQYKNITILHIKSVLQALVLESVRLKELSLVNHQHVSFFSFLITTCSPPLFNTRCINAYLTCPYRFNNLEPTFSHYYKTTILFTYFKFNTSFQLSLK